MLGHHFRYWNTRSKAVILKTFIQSEIVQGVAKKYIATVVPHRALNESLNELLPPFMTLFSSADINTGESSSSSSEFFLK